ncbi:MAG: hypothetical protein ACK4KT_04400 [Thermaurantimonas sp.]
MNRKWILRLSVPFAVGAAIILFFFVNINAILNFFSTKIINYHIFESILLTNKLLFYLISLLFVLYILFFLFYNTREFLLKNFLSVDDFRSYKVQRFLIINSDPYSKYELQKRLHNINFKGLKKTLISFLMLLAVLSIFSFAKFNIPRFENPFNEYISKLNIQLDKEEYLEGDSIYLSIDIPNENLLVEYGNNNFPCSSEKFFIGLANPLNDKLRIKLNNNVVERKVVVHGRPRLNNLFIRTNYNDIIIREYRNVFDVSVFRNSYIEIKALFNGAEHRKIETKFFIEKDTNVVISFCNSYFCDSLDIIFKAVEISKPIITYTKFDGEYLVKVLDDLGIKLILINGSVYSIDQRSRAVEFSLDTLQSYTINVKNICNQTSEIVINRQETQYNDANYSFAGKNSLNILNDIEAQLIEIVNELIENSRNYSFEKYIDRLQNLAEVFNTILEENNNQNKIRANELKLLASEIIDVLIEREKNINSNKDLINEQLVQKLKNTMNKYKNRMKQNEKKVETDFNVESLTIEEQISLEYILLVSNNLSFDIEGGKYKNVKDIYLNSLMPIMLDSLYSIMVRKRAIYDFLINDYNSLRSFDYGGNLVDNRSVIFRLNNISVALYNLIKNIEQKLSAGEENSENNKNDSNCSSPNSGNTKKPGLSELLSDSNQNTTEGEGESEDNTENEDNKGSSPSDKSEDNVSGNGGNNNKERKNKGNTGNGNNETLEEIEKRLRNINANQRAINTETLKKKIKWLDYEYAKRINDNAENRRQGTYVIQNPEEFQMEPNNHKEFKLIKRSSLFLKRNDLY